MSRGFPEIEIRKVAAGRLSSFDTDTAKATREAKDDFHCGGDAAGEGGAEYDLSYLFGAAEQVAKAADGPKTLVIKSTVNPGTGSKMAKLVAKHSTHKIEVVNNPEFLREGTALQDFMEPDRMVFGAISDEGHGVLREIYQPLIDKGYEIYLMSRESAELTKFAANAMLATRISFINELSLLAQAIGADIESVRIGIGTDKRIGPGFLRAGVGYGGSCFPKDVQALVHQMKTIGIEPLLLSGIEAVNVRQKQAFAKRVLDAVKDVPNPVIAVWGLAFKADTDDVREAAAIEVINTILNETKGRATVKAYDPQAIETARKILGDKITYAKSLDECTEGADVVALVTEWAEFISQDFSKVARLMRGKHLFDGRNCLGSKRVTSAGLYYHAIGRPELKPGEGKAGSIGVVSAG